MKAKTRFLGLAGRFVGGVCIAVACFGGVSEGADNAASPSLAAFQLLDSKVLPRRVTLNSDRQVTFEQSKRNPIHRQEEEVFFSDNQQQETRVKARILTPDGNITSSIQHNVFRLKSPERYISVQTKEGKADPWAVTFSDKKQLPDLREKLSNTRVGQLSFGDTKPLGELLKEASEVQEVGNEKIGDSTCVLVKAKTPYGQYSLWLDPANGYQLRRLNVVKKAGDLLGNEVLGAEESTEDNEELPYPISSVSEVEVTLDNVVIKEIDGFPFIVQATESYNERHITGEVVHGTNAVTISEIKCNPNFMADNAFVPRIPNGTPVKYIDFGVPDQVWRDGRPFLKVPDGLEKGVIENLAVKPDTLRKDPASSAEKTSVGVPSVPNAANLAQENVPSRTFRIGIVAALGIGVTLVIAGAFVWKRAYRYSNKANREA